MFNKKKKGQLKRGPWSQKCGNCHYYEDGRCTLHNKPKKTDDWCKQYKRNHQL